jgi:hypothetical protein
MPRTIRDRIREENPEAVAPEPIQVPEPTPAPDTAPEPEQKKTVTEGKITVTAKRAFFLGTAIVDVGQTAEVNQFQFEKLTEKGLV